MTDVSRVLSTLERLLPHLTARYTITGHILSIQSLAVHIYALLGGERFSEGDVPELDT